MRLPYRCILTTLLTVVSIVYCQNRLSAHEIEEIPLPATLTLCGEPVPLDDRNVREMFERELIISACDHAQVILWLKRAGRYFPYIEKQLADKGLPDDLKYVAIAESALLTYGRSDKGALGPWQFMRHTARSNGLRKTGSIDERLNFELSTASALKYLQRLHGMFDSWTLVLAAYNCGENRVKKELQQQKVASYYRLNLPLETERYVFRIAAAKVIMENPEYYGYKLPSTSVYTPIECDTVTVHIRSAVHITAFAEALKTDFKTIKEFNPQFTGHYLPSGSHELKVPPGTGAKAAAVLKKLDRAAPSATGDMYVVRPGDTLSHIAARTGVSVNLLQELNGLKDSVIYVGQKLQLRP